jgi:hypothetical protein
LGTLHGALDGTGGFLDITHYPASNAAAAFKSEPQDFGTRISGLTGDFSYDCHDFGGSEIQGGNQPLGIAHVPARRTIT